jgi:hypothetical protein
VLTDRPTGQRAGLDVESGAEVEAVDHSFQVAILAASPSGNVP